MSFPENLGAPSSIVMETLAEWTTHNNPGVRHFSGTARYHLEFTLSKTFAESGNPVILDLGEVREIADVTVNGQSAGILWNNRIVGDLKHPDQPPAARTNFKANSIPSPLSCRPDCLAR